MLVNCKRVPALPPVLALLASLVALTGLVGCAGEQIPAEPSRQERLSALGAEFEGLCRKEAASHLSEAQARAMCGCMADNHRRLLNPGELQLLIRDYRRDIGDAEREQNNDLNQLFMHDAAVAESCQKDPSFRIDRRLSWLTPATPGSLGSSARMTASAP